MTDDEFLRQAQVDPEHYCAAVHLRHCVAAAAGYPVEELRPSVDTRDLYNSMFMGFDGLDLALRLERRTGRKLPSLHRRLPVFVPVRSKLREHRAPEDFGDWVRRAAVVVAEALREAEEGATRIQVSPVGRWSCLLALLWIPVSFVMAFSLATLMGWDYVKWTGEPQDIVVVFLLLLPLWPICSVGLPWVVKQVIEGGKERARRRRGFPLDR